MKIVLVIFFFSIINEIFSDKSFKIFNYAISKIGCGYIWGGSGQILTEDILTKFKNKYPSFINENKDKKWLGKQVFDCSGFVKSAFDEIDIHIYHEANSAWENTKWSMKEKIEDLPKDKVCIVFKKGSKGMIHTGIYLGNGEVVNAQDNKHGVVKEKLGTLWTHFGIPEGLY